MGHGIFLETYGCQMNELDSELVKSQLQSLGYHFVDSPQQAKIVLLNTCSVRALSEQKVWSQLGRLDVIERKEQRDLIVGVLGCMAEREGQTIIKRVPSVDIVCGPSNLDQLPTLIENALLNTKNHQVVLSGHTSRRTSTLELANDGVEALDLSRAFSAVPQSKQAYVRITRGCNKFCSFCVVPYVRGPEVHRPPEHIVEEIKRLVEAGHQEVTLIGQTVNHYVYKQGERTTSFADLLYKVHEEVTDLPRLRFITSYPRDFGDDALDVMAASPRICRFLHIPAQSGSNRMLKLMNRGYTVEEYLSLVERARARMPDIRLAGDMIVGFPTETDEDHQMSLEFLKTVRYKSCFVFKYSPREGTVANRRFKDDVPEELKKIRNIEMLELQNAISLQHHQEHIGQKFDVLVEGANELKETAAATDNIRLGWLKPTTIQRLIGRTTGDEIVAFNGDATLVGQVVPVHITSTTALTLQGEMG